MNHFVWTKYLPVITLKQKAAARKNELQILKIDRFDFEISSTKKTPNSLSTLK